MKVKIIGLMTGEQLLTEVQDETQTEYLLKKPAILVPAQDRGLGLAPWIPYSKSQTNGITINKHVVSFIVDPVDELRNHYTGSFVGGLVVPSGEVEAPQLQLVEG